MTASFKKNMIWASDDAQQNQENLYAGKFRPRHHPLTSSCHVKHFGNETYMYYSKYRKGLYSHRALLHITNMIYRERNSLGKNLGREKILTHFVRNMPALVFICSVCWSPTLFLKPGFKLFLLGSRSFTTKF